MKKQTNSFQVHIAPALRELRLTELFAREQGRGPYVCAAAGEEGRREEEEKTGQGGVKAPAEQELLQVNEQMIQRAYESAAFA